MSLVDFRSTELRSYNFIANSKVFFNVNINKSILTKICHFNKKNSFYAVTL